MHALQLRHSFTRPFGRELQEGTAGGRRCRNGVEVGQTCHNPLCDLRSLWVQLVNLTCGWSWLTGLRSYQFDRLEGVYRHLPTPVLQPGIHCLTASRTLILFHELSNATFYLRNLSFFRAMLCIRGTSHGPVSVCLCLCLSVCHKSEFY